MVAQGTVSKVGRDLFALVEPRMHDDEIVDRAAPFFH